MPKLISENVLLQVWEIGTGQASIEKALTILSAAFPNTNKTALATWSIEQRDTQLFWIRQSIFGNQFINNANCPQCNEKVEWEMNISDFSLPPFSENIISENYSFNLADYFFNYRLPTSEDLRSEDPIEIFKNCLIESKKNEQDVSFDQLPQEIKESLEKEIQRNSPIANTSMLLNCPNCKHQWTMLFDIVSYLWVEIDIWAKRILQDVFILASNFGWSEQEILNMTPLRRQTYLNMIQS